MTDNYSAVETAVYNILVALTTYFPAGSGTVTYGDYSPLDAGRDRCAVITPGGFVRERGTMSSNLMIWTINVDIFQRYVNSANTYSAFKTMRAAIIDAFADTVGVADVVIEDVKADENPAMITKQGTNTITHLVQSIQIVCQQYVEV